MTEIDSLLTREAIEACVVPGRWELPLVSDFGTRYLIYFAPRFGCR